MVVLKSFYCMSNFCILQQSTAMSERAFVNDFPDYDGAKILTKEGLVCIKVFASD